MRIGIAYACTLIACGRFSFEPIDGSGPGGTTGDGGGSGSGTADALGTGIDGATDRPNRVFVTSTTTTGALGGVDGADALCAAAATTAGLPGTFVPLLSDLTHDVRQRLSGSRGWIRTGDDAPIADRADKLLSDGVIFNAIDRDELGNIVTIGIGTYAWIGATTIGGSVENCLEWTTASGFTNHGRVGGAMTELVSPLNVYTFSCSAVAALTCFEIGHAVPVQPIVATGARLAFLATPSVHGGGVAQLDGQCQSEAAAAGLPGAYVAAVATQGANILQRVALGGASWARPDGTLLSPTAAQFFDGTEPLSFVNQEADGTYVNDQVFIRTGGDPTVAGTNASTCNSWTSTMGSNMVFGIKLARFDAMWSVAQAGCQSMFRTLCLQQ